MCARAPVGWKFSAAVWWTPTSWRPAASIPRNTAASPSAWAWSASLCSNGRSKTSVSTSKTTSASSPNSKRRYKRQVRTLALSTPTHARAYRPRKGAHSVKNHPFALPSGGLFQSEHPRCEFGKRCCGAPPVREACGAGASRNTPSRPPIA